MSVQEANEGNFQEMINKNRPITCTLTFREGRSLASNLSIVHWLSADIDAPGKCTVTLTLRLQVQTGDPQIIVAVASSGLYRNP